MSAISTSVQHLHGRSFHSLLDEGGPELVELFPLILAHTGVLPCCWLCTCTLKSSYVPGMSTAFGGCGQPTPRSAIMVSPMSLDQQQSPTPGKLYSQWCKKRIPGSLDHLLTSPLPHTSDRACPKELPSKICSLLNAVSPLLRAGRTSTSMKLDLLRTHPIPAFNILA
jgi:hypothetical protein